MTKVLLVAPSCDGTDVGEAWLGFQWARRLSERHEVTLLSYRQHGRPSAVPQLPRARVVEWDQPAVLSASPRLNSQLKPWYPLFYRRCRRWIRDALRDGETFDVAHQPTPVGLRYPSPLTGLGIPYVVGPSGGSITSPKGFDEEDTAPWYVGLRVLDHWRLSHDPLLRRSFEGASVVLGIAPYVGEQLTPLHLPDLRFMNDAAVEELPVVEDRTVRSGAVRLLFVGRVIRTKGVRDAIAALANLTDLPVVLDIVGDGFDRPACEELVADLGLGEWVRFHGTQPHDRVDDYYRAADIFVFPSFREPGGIVVMEAMAHGLPLVVADRGGPADVVDETAGVRVPVTSPEQYARDLGDVLRELVLDAPQRLRLGRGARQRVERIGTWSSHVERIERIYADISAH